jgi:hypothetical protein
VPYSCDHRVPPVIQNALRRIFVSNYVTFLRMSPGFPVHEPNAGLAGAATLLWWTVQMNRSPFDTGGNLP